MRNGLFREEVFSARREGSIGVIYVPPPAMGWFFSLLGISVFAGCLLILNFGRYERVENADGILVPSSGLIAVTTHSVGVTAKVLVAEGAHVQAGQALIEISGEEDSAALGGTWASIASQLTLKRERLQSDKDELDRLSIAQEGGSRSRIKILQAQAHEMQAQIALQKQRADSASELYEQWARVGDSGVVPKLQILQQRDNALGSRAQLEELTRQSLDIDQQLEQQQEQLSQYPGAAVTKRNEIERQLADVSRSLSESEVRRAVTFNAPADGIVSNLMVHVGQSVTAQELLLTILPEHAVLQAELWVSSRAIGFIDNGNPVNLRYEAFPYQRFGQRSGKVSLVSRTAVLPAELSKQLGQDVREPRYRVLVDLDDQSMPVNGKGWQLKPGMTLSADILLERRRLFEWIFEPFSFGSTQHASNKLPSVDGRL